ncbi:conserved hypothetical protein [Streptomyces viridochromogenes DSM 40736]|uniref:Uncharacterized protein n=1 Tax=Streptomyces viridochromogenes (strain DSM 40736 / JCM 4977 / BCRC 1201 / Tue 494) TaxID=591159 RepID=D9XEX7_STRVT|nr:conserved hypothetical protein [Streptomyces viridochromogenes DSM 40736]
MDYDAVVDELYALRPEDFTAARASAVAAARTAGDQELAQRIGALRKPSLAAWVSNLLVRSRPGEVQPLLRLGEGLRQAHQDLDGTQLRELSRQQHALIRALSAEARRLAADAGHPVGEAVQREVENTLHAVLADPEAAGAWASGRLAKPLSATVGFPAVAQSAAARSAAVRSTVAEGAGTRRRARGSPLRAGPQGRGAAAAATRSGPPGRRGRRAGTADAEGRGGSRRPGRGRGETGGGPPPAARGGAHRGAGTRQGRTRAGPLRRADGPGTGPHGRSSRPRSRPPGGEDRGPARTPDPVGHLSGPCAQC